MQVRDKPTIHVVMTKQTLAMIDGWARDDAPLGDKPDRSRLLRQMVAREEKRRAKIATAER